MFDEIWDGMADAVADIREKVVEEPMYGRTLSDRDSEPPQWPEAREAEPAQSVEQEIEQAPEQDIDR